MTSYIFQHVGFRRIDVGEHAIQNITALAGLSPLPRLAPLLYSWFVIFDILASRFKQFTDGILRHLLRSLYSCLAPGSAPLAAAAESKAHSARLGIAAPLRDFRRQESGTGRHHDESAIVRLDHCTNLMLPCIFVIFFICAPFRQSLPGSHIRGGAIHVSRRPRSRSLHARKVWRLHVHVSGTFFLVNVYSINRAAVFFRNHLPNHCAVMWKRMLDAKRWRCLPSRQRHRTNPPLHLPLLLPLLRSISSLAATRSSCATVASSRNRATRPTRSKCCAV